MAILTNGLNNPARYLGSFAHPERDAIQLDGNEIAVGFANNACSVRISYSWTYNMEHGFLLPSEPSQQLITIVHGNKRMDVPAYVIVSFHGAELFVASKADDFWSLHFWRGLSDNEIPNAMES